MTKLTDITFVKISATGNDFILIDNREKILTGKEVELFHQICQRRTSVGADGVLLIEACEPYDFRLRYFNADGGESEMCGNGARAAAYYAFKNNFATQEMAFLVGTDLYEAVVQDKWVKLKMPGAKNLKTDLGVLEESFLEEGGSVYTGVPHYVLFVADLESLDVHTLGKKYRHHKVFQPKGTNVNFVQILASNKIKVRTYERGVEEETLACGTGAVASALLSSLNKKTLFPTDVLTRGGLLRVFGDSQGEHLYLEGEVKAVYKGRLISG